MLPLRYGLKQAAKVIMHHRMQQVSEKEGSTILIASIDLKSAEWEDEHEFRLEGQMYDVAGIEYHNGLKYYRCVTDELETQIERRTDGFSGSISRISRIKNRAGLPKHFWTGCRASIYSRRPSKTPAFYRALCTPSLQPLKTL
jgi:hypothetical protein